MTIFRASPLLVFAAIVACASPAGAQTADDLFARGTLHELRLFMNSRDVQDLQDNFQANTYYQADLEWRGLRVRSIAVRSRGEGSRSGQKPGLRVDFDRFASGQRFLGLESLTLDNLWQDDSLIRESVAMAFFARLGQPAPRVSYARLFINGTYYGLYGVVEAIDAPFLARAFGDPGGYAFEYRWQHEFHGEYLGQSLDRYRERFRPESHELEPDASLYLPLHDLFREINRPVSPGWLESVERYLDVRAFLTYVGVEMFMAEIDGILGAWAMNNFYVYRPSGATRHVLVPWDRDHAFQEIDSSVMLRASDNVLVRRLLEHPHLRAYYHEVLEVSASLAASGWLEQEIAATAALIRDAAHADDRKRISNEDFESGVAFLRAFARSRPGIVLAEVRELRARP